MTTRPVYEQEHYVPQFHLQRFGLPSGQIWCFDKASDRSFLANTSKVAQEHGYFEMYGPQRQRESLEDPMELYEKEWRRAIDAVIHDPQMLTVIDNGPKLAEFCAVQLMRPVAFRAFLEETWRDHGMNDGWDDNLSTIAHARFLLGETRNVTDLIMQLGWVLVYNFTPVPFWTSDNPVAMYARDPALVGGPLKELGLTSPGIRLHVPLQAMGPGLALCLHDLNVPLPFEWGQTLTVDQVWALNRQQVRSAGHRVFSPIDNFDVARRLLVDTPALRDPRRTRPE